MNDLSLNDLLSKLHDIQGIDAVSRWPLPLGWWIVIAIAFLMFSMCVWVLVRWIIFRFSWKNDTLKKLKVLEKHLSDANAVETAASLSEYMRRIALKRYSRKECAGLMDKDWLQWLSKNYPKKFDWETKGVVLTQAPYAPLNHGMPKEPIIELIHAAREWVR